MNNLDFPINNRLQFVEKLNADHFLNSRSRIVLRRAILSTQYADSLSDEDLRSHVSELRRRKFFSTISFVAIPTALYFCKLNIRLVVLSLIPAYYVYQSTLCTKFLNGRHDFSYATWRDAVTKHIEKTFNSKEMQIMGAAEKWGLSGSKFEKSKTTLKEWKALHEYR
jgi:hypothetical protein